MGSLAPQQGVISTDRERAGVPRLFSHGLPCGPPPKQFRAVLLASDLQQIPQNCLREELWLDEPELPEA